MSLARACAVGAFAVLLIACGGDDTTLSGGGMHPTGGGGGDGGGDSGGSAGSDSGSPPPDDAGPQAGDPCDPQNNVCPAPLLCCPVGGQPREGGVFNACANPRGTPPACP